MYMCPEEQEYLEAKSSILATTAEEEAVQPLYFFIFIFFNIFLGV